VDLLPEGKMKFKCLLTSYAQTCSRSLTILKHLKLCPCKLEDQNKPIATDRKLINGVWRPWSLFMFELYTLTSKSSSTILIETFEFKVVVYLLRSIHIHRQ
jgi:hypothetical protein